jgi:hypothetical protein
MKDYKQLRRRIDDPFQSKLYGVKETRTVMGRALMTSDVTTVSFWFGFLFLLHLGAIRAEKHCHEAKPFFNCRVLSVSINLLGHPTTSIWPYSALEVA